MLLEARSHEMSSFITLTYRDNPTLHGPLAPGEKWLPVHATGTLVPDDLKNWLKRFRKAISPSKLRFYACGEYGDRGQRPHYHVVGFGYRGCAFGRSRYRDGYTLDCCHWCDLVRDTWGLGIIETQTLTPKLMAYAAGYVMKKMTTVHDDRLGGRHPEFARMSNRPGLGAHQVQAILDSDVHLEKRGDVAPFIRSGGKLMPLGRYLRRLMRIQLGGDGTAPEATLIQMAAELLPLLEASKHDPENITLKKQIVAKAAGTISSMKAKAEMFNSRKRNQTL